MLTGTRLGDDLRLAESFCEEDLADSIVDLVRTGVIQVFSPVSVALISPQIDSSS